MTKNYVCISNTYYPISLTVGKKYTVLPDPTAEKHNMIRVIDDSEEDYLFPEKLFQLIN
jgi:hypothetical protein